jgi:trigger factor
MQTTVEETKKHTVKLTIEVPEQEFSKDLDRAYKKISQQVKVPGFRKGKVPRKIIDAQLGREAVMDEFLTDAVPAYYNEAVRERELAPIADPDISLDQVEEGKPLVFSAEVEVRPRLELDPSEYRGIKVERPSATVDDGEVDELLERVRDRFAELETVSRPAVQGDYVVADIRGSVHGEEVPEATKPDYLYSVGSGEFGEKLDQELLGKRAGEILRFNDTLSAGAGEAAGSEISFSVLVKEVKGKKLPPLDDELAKTASEFDTLDELRASLRESLATGKEREADGIVRDRAIQAMIDRIDVDLPETLVDEETEHRVHSARDRAERAGMTLEQLLEMQGWSEARLRSDARDHAVRAIKADLILEGVARKEDLEVTAEELGQEIGRLAARLGRDPKEIATTLERTDQVVALAGDIIRSKALDLLVEHADITSEGESSAPHEDASVEGPPAESAPEMQREPEQEAEETS